MTLCAENKTTPKSNAQIKSALDQSREEENDVTSGVHMVRANAEGIVRASRALFVRNARDFLSSSRHVPSTYYL